MPKPKKRKRKGPKSTRSGCLLCKPWKANGCTGQHRRRQIARAEQAEREQREAV
jgi:hypothetical protein